MSRCCRRSRYQLETAAMNIAPVSIPALSVCVTLASAVGLRKISRIETICAPPAPNSVPTGCCIQAFSVTMQAPWSSITPARSQRVTARSKAGWPCASEASTSTSDTIAGAIMPSIPMIAWMTSRACSP
jgi:hypothetical protein